MQVHQLDRDYTVPALYSAPWPRTTESIKPSGPWPELHAGLLLLANAWTDRQRGSPTHWPFFLFFISQRERERNVVHCLRRRKKEQKKAPLQNGPKLDLDPLKCQIYPCLCTYYKRSQSQRWVSSRSLGAPPRTSYVRDWRTGNPS